MSHRDSVARKRVVSKPRKRNNNSNNSKKGPGIFQNVLQYVSKEVHSFVVSATGGDLVAEAERDEDESVSSESSPQSTTPRRTERRARHHPKHHQRSSSSKRTIKSGSEPEYTPEGSFEASDPNDHPPIRNSTTQVNGGPSRHLSPSPILSRRGSLSMPGSLFPRSPSPDVSNAKHVHFTPPAAKHSNTSHSTRKAPNKSSVVPADIPLPRSRSASVSSQESDHRHADARYSESRKHTLKLPSPQRLPKRRMAIVPTRSSDPEPQSSRHIGAVQARPPSPLASFKRLDRISSDQRAKSRRDPVPEPGPSRLAIKHLGDDFLRDRSQSIDSLNPPGPPSTTLASSEEPQTRPSRKGKEKAIYDDSFDISGHSRSGSLDDKLRIQMLEDEVQRLRSELSKRPVRGESVERRNSFDHLAPPPPPPPPPPPGYTQTKIPSALETDAWYATARAGLKHQAPPVERPIAPLAAAKHSVLLPVVPADHMQAFLSELKTVRLRKVKSGDNMRDSFADSSFQARRSADTSMLANRTWSAGDASIVASRKRSFETVFGKEGQFNGAKRRLNGDAIGVRRNDSLRSKLPTRVPNGVSTKSTQPVTEHVNPSLPSTSNLSNDSARANLATPSLISDNDADREDDATPGTPPPLPHASPPSPPPFQKRLKTRRSDTVDDDLFSRRPPSSPLVDVRTPKKPKAPARSRTTSKTSSAHFTASDKVDDPLLLPATDDGDHRTVIGSRRRSHSNPDLPQTLDIELNAVEDDMYFEEEILTGLGTLPRGRGFLARGGGGGEPVFLGEGYVQGYQEEWNTSTRRAQR